MIETDTLMEMITRLEERVQRLEGAEEIDYGASLDTNEQCRKHQMFVLHEVSAVGWSRPHSRGVPLR
jgi:hypothetical protein